MAEIICSKCGKGVKVNKPANSGDDSTFVCEKCWAKDNERQIDKEKRINAKLSALVAAGKPYNLDVVVKEVESEMK